MTFNYWCYIQVASQKLILFLKIHLLIWRGFLGTECANYDFISSFPILSVFNFMVSLHQNHESTTDCYQVVLVLCHCSWFTQSDSNVFTFWIMFVGGSVVDMLYEVLFVSIAMLRNFHKLNDLKWHPFNKSFTILQIISFSMMWLDFSILVSKVKIKRSGRMSS